MKNLEEEIDKLRKTIKTLKIQRTMSNEEQLLVRMAESKSLYTLQRKQNKLIKKLKKELKAKAPNEQWTGGDSFF